MTLSAQELYRRGRAHLNAGQNAAARRALARAQERTEDPDLRARIAGSLAAVTIRQGEPETAERLIRDALAGANVSVETAAMLHGQLGLLALERGDLDAAVSWLDRGISGIGASREHRTPMLVNRSVAHMQAGRLAAARADLELAAADYAAAGDDVERAMAVHNAGYVALLEGDLVPALALMSEARTVMERASAVNTAISDVDRAEVLRDAGLTTEAEQILERVARVFGANGMTQARGEAEFNLARSLITHDPAGASAVAAAAARRFRTLGSATWAARAEGVRMRAALSAGGFGRSGNRTAAVRGLPSQDEVDALAAELEKLGFRGDAAALRMTMQLRLARLGEEDDVSPRRVIRQPKGAPMEVKLLGYEVRAARASSAGHNRDARRQAAAGLDLLSSWQSSFGSLDLQTSTRMHSLGLMIEGLASAVRSRKPEVLFEWSERARHSSQQVVPLRPPPDPGLANDLAELRMLRMDNPSGDWLADPHAMALRDRARERQWSATGSATVQERVTLEEFRAHLDDDTALLSYVYSGDELSCLVVTRHRTAVVDLGAWGTVSRLLSGLRADLDVSASIRSGPMAAIVQRALDERLARISSALLGEPLRVAAAARRIIVTSPGVLSGVPWAMLPAMRGRAFTLAVSATRWAGFHLSDEGGEERSLRTAGFAVGPRVARGNEEIAAATSAWTSANALRSEDAAVAAVTDLAAAVDVLHVAAHGRHAVDNPLFSGLELADGTLFGYDIDLMPRVPDTVVLSACEVGRSSVRWGEEALGMTRIWLHAGSRVVIAAPVVVADDVACELLGALHVGLVGGLTPSEALAVASESTGLVAPFQAHGAGF